MLNYLQETKGVKIIEFQGNVHRVREELHKIKQQQGSGRPHPLVTQEEVLVLGRDGNKIPIRIYRPKESPVQPGPLFVMYHGGGFALGDRDDAEHDICNMFTTSLAAVCVNVEYRLAPEFPFPTAIDDSWDALKWVGLLFPSLGTVVLDGTRSTCIGISLKICAAPRWLKTHSKSGPTPKRDSSSAAPLLEGTLPMFWAIWQEMSGWIHL